jgi:predicted nuclease of predicted toxin-antitoxin system
MKLLLDQGLPRSTATLLRSRNIDSVHVGEVGLAKADDTVILERGRLEERTIVTLDADFHKLLALTRATTPSVIRIRIEGLRADALADLLERILEQSSVDIEAGAAVTVQAQRLHIRRLPLIR